MLAVVHNEERPRRCEQLHEPLAGLPVPAVTERLRQGHIADAEGVEHRLRHAGRVGDGCQLDQPRAVRDGGLGGGELVAQEPSGDLLGQPRLAGAAGTDDGDEPAGDQAGPHRPDVVVPADEARQSGTQVGRRRSGAVSEPEDLEMLLPQRGRRVGSEGLGERGACVFEGGECLRGAARRDERIQKGDDEILAQRVRGGELLQVGDDVPGPARTNGQTGPVAEGLQPQIVEGGADGAGLDGDVIGQRFAPPQRQGLVHRFSGLGVTAGVQQSGGFGDEPREPGPVHGLSVEDEPVAGR
jgi:hypothetical protein